MQTLDFVDQIKACDELEVVDIVKDEEYMVIKYIPKDQHYRVTVAAIKENEWKVLKDILTEVREAIVLDHFARIVGYFSKVSNWNKSKLGELKDRHEGDYSILPEEKIKTKKETQVYAEASK